jgi:hypothetical protein
VDPLAAARPIHSRTLDVEVCDTGDGTWAVSGELVDLRKSGFAPVAGDLQMSGLLHHMRVRARVDPGTGILEEIDAEQPAVAFESSSLSCGESCRDPVDRIRSLAGTTIASGFSGRLNEAIGGPRGCTHVLTLAHLVGTTLTCLAAHEHSLPAMRRRPSERIFRRSLCFDGSQRSGGELEIAVQLTDLHFAPAPEIVRPMERFAKQVEVRAAAALDLGDLALRTLEVAQRERTLDALESADWISFAEEVRPFVGQPVARGMRNRVLGRFEATAEGAPLVSVLLNLAPAVFQCLASLSEPWPAIAARDSGLIFSGGLADSCYMWRREGALGRIKAREQGSSHQGSTTTRPNEPSPPSSSPRAAGTRRSRGGTKSSTSGMTSE